MRWNPVHCADRHCPHPLRQSRALTRSPARRTGLAMDRLVGHALERLASELRTGANAQPLGAVWTIAADGRRG